VTCPNCHRRLRLFDSGARRKLRCPACATPVTPQTQSDVNHPSSASLAPALREISTDQAAPTLFDVKKEWTVTVQCPSVSQTVKLPVTTRGGEFAGALTCPLCGTVTQVAITTLASKRALLMLQVAVVALAVCLAVSCYRDFLMALRAGKIIKPWLMATGALMWTVGGLCGICIAIANAIECFAHTTKVTWEVVSQELGGTRHDILAVEPAMPTAVPGSASEPAPPRD